MSIRHPKAKTGKRPVPVLEIPAVERPPDAKLFKTREEAQQEQRIHLQNPVSDHFSTWVIGNALVWETLAHDELIRVAPDAALALEPYGGLLEYYASDFTDRALFKKWEAFRNAVDQRLEQKFMTRQNEGKGKTLVLCGAGPSLAENAENWFGRLIRKMGWVGKQLRRIGPLRRRMGICWRGDQVWGCNSALHYLVEQGYPVTHGITVDQTPEMLNEWVSVPDVEYLLATTVHPNLSRYLKDSERRIRYFHNFVGMQGPMVGHDGTALPFEDWLYVLLYPPTLRCGSGLNTANRALDVAEYMGFDKIYVLGADCALRFSSPPPDAEIGSPEHKAWLEQDVVMHADGGHALASGATAVTLSGEIDGRLWVTKPDMVISAVWLLKQAKRSNGRIELIGDTLPNAIKDKPEEFLSRLPYLETSDGKRVPILDEAKEA